MTIGSEESTNSNISVIANGKFSSLVENGWQTANDNKGGNSELKIYGGNFTGGAYVIKNDDYGVMEINDGNFNCEDSKTLTAAILNWNEATINGSTFKVGESPVGAYAIYNGYGDDTYEKGSITVTDGTFIYPETSDGIIP